MHGIMSDFNVLGNGDEISCLAANCMEQAITENKKTSIHPTRHKNGVNDLCTSKHHGAICEIKAGQKRPA